MSDANRSGENPREFLLELHYNASVQIIVPFAAAKQVSDGLTSKTSNWKALLTFSITYL